ncbi:MAG: hypothetical protein Q7R67_00150 [bacterium]|nr:hypothetical protein [bacterium]
MGNDSQMFFGDKKMLKKIGLSVLSAFFAGGAVLWFWVAYTQSNPEMARAAFMIALGPTTAAILFAHKARWINKPNR